MAKDPAVLFYTSDFLTGTILMNYEQKGKYITLLCIQHQHGIIDKNSFDLIVGNDIMIKSKFLENTNGFYNQRMLEESNKRKSYCESRRQSRLTSNEDNVKIYLIKDLETGYIKIGSSVNPNRRFAEMCNQKNPAITVGSRKYKLIFVSKKTLRSEESKLHSLFESKRITGEWFDLNSTDFEYVRKTYGERTVNENENEDVIEVGITDEVVNAKEVNTKKCVFKKPNKTEIIDYINENQLKVDSEVFYDHYESNGWKVGKVPMKDWKATLRNWDRKTKEVKKPFKNEFLDKLEQERAI